MPQSFHTLRAHAGRLDDPGHRDNLLTPDDERPGLALRPRDLRVHEEILNLLRAVCEPVTGAPATDLETRNRRRDPPRSPPHLSLQLNRAALKPDAIIFAHRLQPAAEVDSG